MAHMSSNELSLSMQNALTEVVDITKEIGDLSLRIVTKLQRPLEDTSDNIRCLLKETWTLFKTINQKIRTVQEILKTKLPQEFKLLDIFDLKQQAETFPVTDKQYSIRPGPPFSVKLPTTLPLTMSTPSQTKDSNSTKPITPKTPILNTTLPPLTTMHDIKTVVKDNGRADGAKCTARHDDVMVREDKDPDDAAIASYLGYDFGSAISSIFSTSGMDALLLNPDFQSQLMSQSQAAPFVNFSGHLMIWMGEQHHTDHGDGDDLVKWIVQVIFEECIGCFKRGLQHPHFRADEWCFKQMDLSQFLIDIDKEVEKVKQSQALPVRGNGPDTILCLDTSASMCGEKFRKMTVVANQIIDGIEELANDQELLGNVAVTTFGTHSSVDIHLTNDYPQVRSVIDSRVAGGPSTLSRGLSMSIAACIGNYADVSVNDVHLMARVILITDGKYSPEDAKEEQFNFDQTNDIMVPLAANLMKLNGIMCYCVHIGASAESIDMVGVVDEAEDAYFYDTPGFILLYFNKQLLQILAQTTKGKILPDDHVDELIKMPTHMFEATNLIRQFPDVVDQENNTRENEEASLQALLDLESSTRGEFQREFSTQEKVSEQNEYLVQEINSDLPPVGTRVRRGPDWDPKDNQDSGGPGTLVCHNNNGTVDVLWDCRIIPLPYHCYDPCQILSTDNDERLPTEDGLIQVGCKVVRGPVWTYGDDDGGQGSRGVVCLCTRTESVMVRWPSKKIGKYRYREEVVAFVTAMEQPQAAGYDSSMPILEYEPGNKATLSDHQHYSKQYKNVDFTTYFTGTTDSNTTLLMPKKPIGHENTDDISQVPLRQEQDCSHTEFQKLPEHDISSPFLWSYQQEGQVEWTLCDASNTRKLESDWSKHYKTSVVVVNENRYRVVFEKMTMSSIDRIHDQKQIKWPVKRERNNTKGLEDTED